MTPPFPEPRAAYVHVPFCARRCGYCNFTLVAGRDDLIEQYLRALEIELSGLGQPREVDTLFFGGGTPSHLPPRDLERLLTLVRHWLPPAAGAEISLEANPSDIEPSRVDILAQHGVNRVSLGAQSLNNAKLERLERDHTAADVERAVELLRPAVASLALDLIFAAPLETLDQWNDDLIAALALEPDHLSTYGLTIERGTTFWNRLARGELAVLDEERQRSMYTLALERLPARGYEHYEVSNFARPGHACRHHAVYWSGGEYFAFGPGAARYVAGRRETNHRSTSSYLKRVLAGGSAVADIDELPSDQRAIERLVVGLRRIAGVTRDELRAATGFSLDALCGQPLARLVALGMLEDDGQRIRLTREGLYISDSLWGELLAGCGAVE